MAAFNGEQWVETQLLSVLSQLGPHDEVVLVDDASSDRTLEIVSELKDSRIRVFRNERNVGVDSTFERALAFAQGDILFFCDQDDIWYSNKVASVMRAFENHHEVTLVMSDARILNADGDATGESYFGLRGRFIPGVFANVVKCKFLGCAMAVRAEMRERFLPFPRRIPGHDMWIGVVNELYGKSLFIPEPLIGYRRHGRNTSPERRQGIWQMLLWRWQLVSGLLARLVQQAVRSWTKIR